MLNIKSKALKLFAGLMVAAFVLVGVSGVNHASAATISFTSKVVKKGAPKADVMTLQSALNTALGTSLSAPLVVDGSYGAKTTAAIKMFQNWVNTQGGTTLTADGIAGPLTLAKLTAVVAGGSMGGTSMVPGCTSTTGFSSTTGTPCGSNVVNNNPGTSMVPGCTSTTGFSATTGESCATGTVTQSGPISVSLSSDTPKAGYVISNQASADLAHFTLTGTGTVNSVTLMRTGISDQNTLSNVYLYNGNTRLTDGYSFNNSGTLTMTNLGLMVNGSITISVKADISSTAGTTASTIGIAITSVTSGTTASTVNVAGNMMYVGTGTPATVYIDAAQQTVTGTPSVNAGTSAYTVWSNPIQVNTRAITLNGANFRMIGSAPVGALANIKIYVDGVDSGKVATVSPINGSNYAMFDFSAAPIALTTGSHTIDVRADVVSGSSYTVQVSLQQAADLVLFDPQLGINIAASKNGSAAYVASNAGTITINAGSASVVIDPTFSAMTNVTGGATNVDIAKFKVHGYGEDVKVSTLSVTPVISGTTPAAAGLNNVTLYFNGSQVGSQQAWTSGALTFNLGSQLIVPAATDSTIEVRADLQTTGSVNYTAGTVAATLNVGSSNGQGQTSHTTLNFPASQTVGTSLTIQTGLLAVSTNGAYTNQNANPNTSGVKIGSYILQNQSTSEPVRVTSLIVGIGGTSALTNLSSLMTSETSGSGATPVQPTATNTFSVDFTLAPGATKTIDILANTSTDTGHTVITTLAVTAIGSNSHVSLQQNGNGTAVTGQTITLAAGTINAAPTLLTASATTAQYVAAANGATDATKATYNFAATGGTATITELKFSATGATTITSVRVGTVSAPVVGGVAYLTGLSLAVPNGSSGLNQDVYVTYPVVGTNGLASGTTSALSLTYVKYSSGGTTTTLSTGDNSLNGGTAIAAPTMKLVGSKPTVTAAKPSTVVAAGNVEAIDITVSADAAGNIALNTLPITVTPSSTATLGTTANTIIVKDSNNTTVATTNTAFSANGSTSVITFTGGYTIQAGQSQTFKIYVPVASTTPSGVNSVSLSTVPATGSNFSWTDIAGAAGSPQTGTTLIPSYPSTFTSVIYN